MLHCTALHCTVLYCSQIVVFCIQRAKQYCTVPTVTSTLSRCDPDYPAEIHPFVARGQRNEIDKEAVVSLVNVKASRPEQAASQRVPTLRLFSHLGTSNSFPQLRYYTTRKEGVICRVSITMPFIYYGTW